MRNLIFLTIDIILFFILYLGLHINWVIAFFASTALTWAGYYLYYWLFPKAWHPRY